MNKHSHHKVLFRLITATLLGVMLVTGKSYALTLSPTRFEISGDPGQTLTEKMTVVNESEGPQVYYSSFANFEAQGDSGTPSFVTPKEDLGTWMQTDESIVLKKGEAKTVYFTVNIPKNAESGGHFASIFWSTTPNTPSSGVGVGAKTGILVLLSVSGDVKESAGLVDFKLHNNKHFYKMLPVGFEYHFSNQGNDRVKPEGSIFVRSLFGWTVKKLDANPSQGNVLPKTTRKFTPEWSDQKTVEDYDQESLLNKKYSFKSSVKDEWHNFAVGIFRAKIVVQFGTANQTIKSSAVYFVVFPWELLLIILIIGIPVFLILRAILRRYNRSIIRKAQAGFESRQL